jgi:hypothetical protein
MGNHDGQQYDPSMFSMEDLGPMVNGVVWFLAIIAGIVLALRFWCKMSRGKGLWVDDYWLIASLVSIRTTHRYDIQTD